MKKKLLAEIMALALCSTSMPQMIFAEEFTSGVLEEVTPEETDEMPEVFTDENQAATGDAVGGVSEFSSKEVPEFDDESDNAAAVTDNSDTTSIKEININSPSDSGSGFTYINSVCTISAPGSYRFTGNDSETSNRIVIDNITSGTVNIYLKNVNISTGAGPALHIKSTVTTQVCIYLEGRNILKTTNYLSAALQKDNSANLTIDNIENSNTDGILFADAACSSYNLGAGIGGGGNSDSDNQGRNGDNISISGGSITASSRSGAGIGGGGSENNQGGNGSNISISGGSVTASSTSGAGIGGGGSGTNGYQGGNGSNISISSGFVKVSSHSGAGIGGGYGSTKGGDGCNISISDGSVTASSNFGAGIGGGAGFYNNGGNGNTIFISGGSITASSQLFGAGIGGGSSTGNGGNGNNISISGGFITAYSNPRPYSQLNYPGGTGIGGSAGINSKGNAGSGNNIYIYDGCVNANSISCSPTDSEGNDLYLFTIPNPSNSQISIDGIEWKPYNCSGIISSDTNLYPWLTGENHVITIDGVTKRYRFNNTSGGTDPFSEIDSSEKLTVTSKNFTFTPPSNLVYDGKPKEAIIKSKSALITGSDFTWKYFFNDKELSAPPVNPGTYTVKINVKESTFYQSAQILTSSNWNFTIKPKPITVTIENKEKIYGETNPPLTFTVPDDALVENDTKESLGIMLKTDAETLSPVRDYSIELDSSNSFINSNYDITVLEGTLTIKKSNRTPNLPTNKQISVPWSCRNVSEINTTDILPAKWKWKDTDDSKELQLGENSIIAVYDGTDKGNYETETVTYTITRSACEHSHTVGRYYSSASCTSSGYSGDTYCTDCGALLSSGYTISAYGHSYDNGMITTEPTAETDGVVTYTCKRCKYQKMQTLGKLNDGEPYIEGDFLKKGWDSVKEIIKKSKEKDIVSITLNGAQTLPASVLSELKGKDIDLSLNMENGFIWKVNGTSITAEAPADMDLSVAKATDYIPASLYKLVSTNQNDFAFHLGTSGAFDFPMGLSVKADASCAGLMANLFWYDAQNQILPCIQSATVGGAFERSIPYADFTVSKGQDYFVVFATESFNGRSIHMDGSITDENGTYLRPADTAISSCSVDRNKLTVKLAKGCAGAQGYDFAVGRKSNMTQTGKFSKTFSSQSKPQASFKYLAKGTWYVASRSWVLDTQGNKVYGSWTKVKKIRITVVTPQQPKIKKVTVKGNTVTITYSNCKNADGYEIVLGEEYKTSADEKYPVKKYVKRTKNTTTVTFTNLKKGTWYLGVRSWTQPSKAKYKTYSPYSAMKKFKIKK